ncbi:MAG: class I SAM-dependent methyltransferase [Alphaproteobacteria bacterium]|nr:class I SAM-dependent methyltransferase [Alphaproteobacteria bacterium]
MDPQQRSIAEEFDAYDESYNQAVNKAIAFSGQSVNAFVEAKAVDLMAYAKRHFGDGEPVRILDVGCGVGNYHPFLATEFDDIVGIDVSSACIAKAKQNNPSVHYDAYDGETLPYEDASFSLAYTICVMHHVPKANWERFAHEIARVVKPGGLVLVYEHNPWHPLTLKAVNDCPFDKDAVLLPMPKTAQLLRQAGCKMVNVRSILTVPPWGGSWARADAWLGRLPFGSQYRAVGYL